MTDPWCFQLRCYIETESAEAAQGITEQITELLTRFTSTTQRPLERYWKIPEYQEVMYEWQCSTNPAALYRAVQQALGPQWHEINEESAVWDYRMHTPLIFPCLRWANLEYFPCSAKVLDHDTSN